MLTNEQAKELDKKAQLELKIPALILMENAGRSAAEIIAREYNSIEGKKILLYIGSGNNGGDGLVIARHLKRLGALPYLNIIRPPKTGQAIINRDIADNLGIEEKDIKKPDIVIDAMLGIGIKDEPKEPYRSAIEDFNSKKAIHISIDTPSGIGSRTAARPDMTITFIDRKTGMYCDNSGKIIVSDIGY